MGLAALGAGARAELPRVLLPLLHTKLVYEQQSLRECKGHAVAHLFEGGWDGALDRGEQRLDRRVAAALPVDPWLAPFLHTF